MNNQEEIEKKEKEWLESLLWWKHLIDSYEYGTAFLILTNTDPKINDLTLDFIPALKRRRGYRKILILSDQNKNMIVVQKRKLRDTDCLLCDSRKIETFCHLENAMRIMPDVYINISKGRDDFVFSRFLRTLTIEDVIARGFLRLSYVPEKKECEDFTYISKYPGKKIKKDLFEKWIPFERINYKSISGYLHDCFAKLDNFFQRDSVIVFYGDTRMTEEGITLMREEYFCRIVDRDDKKKGTKRNDITVEALSTFYEQPHNEKIVILITVYQFEEICEQLEEIGYRLGKQVFLLNYRPDIRYISKNSLVNDLRKKTGKGYEIYKRIRMEYPREKLLLSPWVASGDIYIAGLYLVDYLKENCEVGYVIVVSSTSARKISELFGFQSLQISEDEGYELLDFARLFGYEATNCWCINANAGGARESEFCNVIDFNTHFQLGVFDFPIKKIAPKMYQESAEELFRSLHLKPGKTILFAPYSATYGMIDEELCSELLKCFISNGYDVCTNISGKEKPLPGTKGVFVPYSQIIDFLDRAGIFWGIRSGLCDIASSTKAKMIVYYRDIGSYSYFSLIRMKLKTSGILELVQECESSSSVIKKTLELLS